MLSWKVVAATVSSFFAITFALCVVYGLIAPARFHAAWFLEALLPGFRWLTFGSVVLGVIEAALYGAWAGFLYSTLYNYFARRVQGGVSRRSSAPRAA